MNANPNYWGGKPAIDEVVFRLFNNADAMVAALKTGEIDAAFQVPSESFESCFEGEERRCAPGRAGRLRRDQRQRRSARGPAGRRDRQRASGALEHPTFAVPSRTRSTSRCSIDRVYNGLGAARDRDQPVRQPEVGTRHPGRPAVRLRPRQGASAPRRGRAQGHERRRHPRVPGQERQPRLLHPLRLDRPRPVSRSSSATG